MIGGDGATRFPRMSTAFSRLCPGARTPRASFGRGLGGQGQGAL
jgi:hypothetical protein